MVRKNFTTVATMGSMNVRDFTPMMVIMAYREKANTGDRFGPKLASPTPLAYPKNVPAEAPSSSKLSKPTGVPNSFVTTAGVEFEMLCMVASATSIGAVSKACVGVAVPGWGVTVGVPGPVVGGIAVSTYVGMGVGEASRGKAGSDQGTGPQGKPFPQFPNVMTISSSRTFMIFAPQSEGCL
jgi:hypothetical protein